MLDALDKFSEANPSWTVMLSEDGDKALIAGDQLESSDGRCHGFVRQSIQHRRSHVPHIVLLRMANDQCAAWHLDRDSHTRSSDISRCIQWMPGHSPQNVTQARILSQILIIL
jgi:hypothetical protein